MGLGDVKMLAMIGAFLGWQQVWVVLFLATLAGALFGVTLLAIQKRSLASRAAVRHLPRHGGLRRVARRRAARALVRESVPVIAASQFLQHQKAVVRIFCTRSLSGAIYLGHFAVGSRVAISPSHAMAAARDDGFHARRDLRGDGAAVLAATGIAQLFARGRWRRRRSRACRRRRPCWRARRSRRCARLRGLTPRFRRTAAVARPQRHGLCRASRRARCRRRHRPHRRPAAGSSVAGRSARCLKTR